MAYKLVGKIPAKSIELPEIQITAIFYTFETPKAVDFLSCQNSIDFDLSLFLQIVRIYLFNQSENLLLISPLAETQLVKKILLYIF